MDAISTAGLTKFYGRVRAGGGGAAHDDPRTSQASRSDAGKRRGIEDLDLGVNQGEIFGFLGPNGAGKTTTIRLLLDLIRPTRGQASVLGHDVWREGLAVRERVGFLAGDVALYPGLRVEEYLRFMGSLTPGFSPARMRILAARVDLDLLQEIHGLSKGNRQKVGLVAALQHRPEVLILDEPTSGLDPLLQQELHRVLREERERGATVFMSSHDLAEVQAVCDRAAILREGRLVRIADVAALREVRDRRYVVTFADGAAPPEALSGAAVERRDGQHVTYRLSGPVAPFLAALARHEPLDLREVSVSLEDVFLRLYGTPHGQP